MNGMINRYQSEILPFEDFGSFVRRAWTPEKLANMSDAEILAKLAELGIETAPVQFAQETDG